MKKFSLRLDRFGKNKQAIWLRRILLVASLGTLAGISDFAASFVPLMRYLTVVLSASLVLVSFASDVPPARRPPNVVLILADDLGYGDLGSYGAYGYTTPHLDRMAAEGLRLTHYYAAQAVCSASRAGLLTGCYPNRVGISGALMPWAKHGLNPEEQTIAELLKTKGYATGIFGKWHLGHHREFLPLQQGFDEYVGLPYSNDMWPVEYDGKPVTEATKYRQKLQYPPLPLLEGNEKIGELGTLADQNRLTTLLTERAVDFIKRHRREPFFLYLPHPMPHVPLGVSENFSTKSAQGKYGDVIEELDWSVGQILATLKQLKLDENTLVMFTSDNGPWMNYGNHAGSNGGLREGKGSCWEGGLRVPFIARWPGQVPAGVVSNAMASALDVLPTLADLCHTDPPARRIDGVSLVPLLRGDAAAQPREAFYFYFDENNLKAVRRGPWKLVVPHGSRTYAGLPGRDGFPGAVSERDSVRLALYDLRRDPGERFDVQAQHPDVVAQLQQLAEQARSDLGDNLTQRRGTNRRAAGLVAAP